MATPYIQVENLTKSYGDRLLFGDVTFGIDEGQKIGLIAKNGTGKSTLLRIIAGEEAPDSGTVTARGGLKVGYLPQTPRFDGALTVADVVTAHAPESAEEAEAYRSRLTRMLSQLHITDLTAPVAKLSGGERKRIALAQALVDDPDLLILDEPTNHLDMDAIEWMEGYLRKSRVALLLVTHDRYFLDRVCNKIIELDRSELFSYAGNYDYYLRKRSERIEALTGELAKVRNTLRREQEWMSRQPQARGGKAKYRIDAFHDLKSRSRANYDERQVKLDVKSSYIGSKILEAEGLTKCYGDKRVLDDFTYTFARYEKVGVIGPNGVGKSTFIKLLQGLETPDSGHVELGETVRIGYYSQEGISFDEGKRVIDAVTEIAEDVVLNDGAMRFSPMQFLQRFLFTPADQQKYIRTLSGGEKCRLHLAVTLMRSPNFLILDEPTNDLDIVTLGVLEEYLREFKGCVLVISHDRFFLDSIVDHLFVFTGDGNVKDFPGSYSDYRAWLAEREAERRARAATATPAEPASKRPQRERKRRLTFAERKELEQLTADIESLTAEKAAMDARFQSGEPIDDVASLSERYSAVSEELDTKELRWLELSEIEEG